MATVSIDQSAARNKTVGESRWARFNTNVGLEKIRVFEVYSALRTDDCFRTLICRVLPVQGVTVRDSLAAFCEALDGSRAAPQSYSDGLIILNAVHLSDSEHELNVKLTLAEFDRGKHEDGVFSEVIEALGFLRIDIRTSSGVVGFSYRKLHPAKPAYELTVLLADGIRFGPPLLEWVRRQHVQTYLRGEQPVDFHELITYLNDRWK